MTTSALSGGCGVTDDGQPASPHVAGEHQTHGPASLRAVEHDGGRAEDVASVGETGAHTRHHVEPEIIRQADHLLQYLRCVLGVVQRLRMLLSAPLEEFGILDLDPRRVCKHDRAEVAGCGGGVNGPWVAGPHQKRQSAGMVDVRVAEHDGIDPIHRKREYLILLA